MVAVIPLIFAIVAALVYALTNNGKVAALALAMWGGSWLVLMLGLSGKTVRFLQ